MNQTIKLINSIKKIKNFLNIRSKEEEDMQDSIYYLQENAMKLKSIYPLKKLKNKSKTIECSVVNLHLHLLDIITDLKDIDMLITKTIENKNS